MLKLHRAIAALCAAGMFVAVPAARANESLEVLHWWTSGGESKAAAVLKADMEKQGYRWKDFAIAGGDGAAAMTTLKTQVISGNAPSAAQIKGPLIKAWADEGMLTEIDPAAQGWNNLLPSQINTLMQDRGHYVAVPFSVHRVNWLWFNAAALKKVGAQPPTTWPEFFALADKLKAAGYIPIADGGQPWQDLTIWETVVLSQGADFYKKAIVDLDPATLASPQMAQVFETVRRIQGYFDNARSGRDWNLATAMVINGRAGMQFMGDWAKGEFSGAHQSAGKEYICAPVPGTAQSFIYNVDSFAFFQKKNQTGPTPGQLALARTIMSPDFQTQFALNKGSVPARLDVSMEHFDACAKKSFADEQVALKNGSYLPSLAHGMAQSEAISGAMTDAVTQFMNSNESVQTALENLAQAAKTR